MRLANLRYIPQIRTSAVSGFRGINKCEDIADDEFVEAQGVSLRNYPAICSRNKDGLKFEHVPIDDETPFIRACFYHNNKINLIVDYKKNNSNIESVLIEGITLVEGSSISGRPIINNIIKIGYYKYSPIVVLMGSNVCLFAGNGQVFNTITKERKPINQSMSVFNAVFEPAFNGSAFTKIFLPNSNIVFSKYDAVSILGCVNKEFNTTKIITDIGTDYIVVAGKINERFRNDERLYIERTAPRFSWVCESKNRLWGCSYDGKEIRASKLGDPYNFNVFEGISTDSYAASVGSEGSFTACASFLGHIYYFKENTIHKVFGDKPANFQIVDYEVKGVKFGCGDSICVIDDIMYYAGIDGIYAYDGTIPVNISKKLGDIKLDNVCGGELEGNYIFSSTYSINNANDSRLKSIIVDIYIYYPKYKSFILYKTESSLYKKELYTSIAYALHDKKYRFTKYKDKLLCWNYHSISYIYDSSSLFETSINSDDNRTSCLISKYMQESTIMHKYITKLLFDIELGQNSTVTISLQYDDDKLWTEVFSTTSESHKTISVPILPRRCKKFRYKIDAIKDFILRGVVKFIEEGSEVDGFI